jgi:hypothetical protein
MSIMKAIELIIIAIVLFMTAFWHIDLGYRRKTGLLVRRVDEYTALVVVMALVVLLIINIASRG